jgi:uncharacterized repeat protein (TIGR01451 family)
MSKQTAHWRLSSFALVQALLGCCALVQTGCLHPPITPAETFGQQLYNVQPGLPPGPPTAAPIPPSGPVSIDLGTPIGVPATTGAPVAAPALPAAPPSIAAPPVASVAPAAPIAAPAPAPIAVTAPTPTAVAVPAPTAPAIESGLLLSPGAVVAPVGANVVMVAGVYGPGRILIPGRRVDWTLASGGVGQITGVGAAPGGIFGIGAAGGQKINQLYAINETFSRDLVVAHGSGTGLGDLTITRGQTWISVSSPNEGTSYVTALAPEFDNWVARQQTALIHWVDAQWTAAPPAVGPAGSRHVFTTTLTRRTTGAPLAGWRVRYEITGGPAAGFAPDAGQAIEVQTNELGQASAEIFQPVPAAGASPILIQIIRPEGLVPGGQRLVVGTAATEQTWTGAAGTTTIVPAAPTTPGAVQPPIISGGQPPIISGGQPVPGAGQIVPGGGSTPPGGAAPPAAAAQVTLRMTGPSQASVGVTASYRIDVTNPGGQPATGVVVSDPLPEGLTYLQSNPAAERGVSAAANAASALQWTLNTLQPGETRTIQLDVRPDRAGAINHCASVRTAEGLTGQDCVTTTVRGAAVELHVSGPDKATVGQQVRFALEIVNRSNAPATGLRIRDRYDDGFTHVIGKNPIEVELDPLAAGQTASKGVTFTVVKPGHLCHTFELLTSAGVIQTAQVCLDATAAAATNAAVSVKITGPASAHVDEKALFTIVVTNTGDSKLSNLQITNGFDPQQLEPKTASEGYKQVATGLAWTIAALDPGQTAQRQVDFACRAAAAKVCVQATVADASGAVIGSDQACMEVQMPEAAAGGKLNVTVAATSNPIKVGAETKFIVTVSNAGANPERKVALSVTVPDQLQYVEGSTQNPTKANAEGQTVRFEPVLQLDPDKPDRFEVGAKALRAGAATLHVDVTSQTTMQPVSSETTITVLPQ